MAVLPKATRGFEDTTDQTGRLPLRALLFVHETFSYLQLLGKAMAGAIFLDPIVDKRHGIPPHSER